MRCCDGATLRCGIMNFDYLRACLSTALCLDCAHGFQISDDKSHASQPADEAAAEVVLTEGTPRGGSYAGRAALMGGLWCKCTHAWLICPVKLGLVFCFAGSKQRS